MPTLRQATDVEVLIASGKKAKVTIGSVYALGQKLRTQCKLRPRIRPEMTPAEKNQAMDDALQQFVNCLARSVR